MPDIFGIAYWIMTVNSANLARRRLENRPLLLTTLCFQRQKPDISHKNGEKKTYLLEFEPSTLTHQLVHRGAAVIRLADAVYGNDWNTETPGASGTRSRHRVLQAISNKIPPPSTSPASLPAAVPHLYTLARKILSRPGSYGREQLHRSRVQKSTGWWMCR